MVVASLALVPPRQPEDWRRSLRWAAALVTLGVVWFLRRLPVLPGLGRGRRCARRCTSGSSSARRRRRSKRWRRLPRSSPIGLGAWVVLALGAPRVAVLVLPWAWSLSSGQWSLRYLSTEQWHEVRYTIPVVGMGLAAGLIGYARLGSWLLGRRRGARALAAVWLAAALWGGLGVATSPPDSTAPPPDRPRRGPRPLALDRARRAGRRRDRRLRRVDPLVIAALALRLSIPREPPRELPDPRPRDPLGLPRSRLARPPRVPPAGVRPRPPRPKRGDPEARKPLTRDITR